MPLSNRDSIFKDGLYCVECWMVDMSSGKNILTKFAFDGIDDFQSQNGTSDPRDVAVRKMAAFFHDVASAKYDRDGLDKEGAVVVRTVDVFGFPDVIRRYSAFK